MVWSFLFAIGLVQGIFLILVFARRPGGNRRAALLLQVLLALFVLSNFDDLLLSTGWYRAAPGLFGGSLSALFAYGPLFYLYIEAVSNPERRWRRRMAWHFLPLLLSLILNVSFFSLPPAAKIRLLDDFLGGQLPVRLFNTVLSAVQLLHLGVYAGLALRSVRDLRRRPEPGALQVPLQRRAGWLGILTGLFALIPVALAVLIAANLAYGYYLPGPNFCFTLITSAILYFMAYQLMLHPERVTPDFSKKYRAVRFKPSEEQALLERLAQLLEAESVITDPELSLAALAARLQLPAHRLSTLINEHYGISFSDLINRRRVERFIACLNDPRYAHFTLHGLALEVGFNSKSAFNAAFKKVTGKSPSQFKG